MDCDRAFFAHLLAFLGVGYCMLARKHLFDVHMSDKGDGGHRSTVSSDDFPELYTFVFVFFLFECENF